MNNDQTWAVIIGAATVAALRIIDFFFPRAVGTTGVADLPREEDDRQDAEDASDDARTDRKRRGIDKESETSRRARDKKRHDEGSAND